MFKKRSLSRGYPVKMKLATNAENKTQRSLYDEPNWTKHFDFLLWQHHDDHAMTARLDGSVEPVRYQGYTAAPTFSQ